MPWTRRSTGGRKGGAAPRTSAAARNRRALRNPQADAPYPDLLCRSFATWSPAQGWRVRVTGPCTVAQAADDRPLVYNPLATQRLMLESINAARRAEGLGPLALPARFRFMSPVEQLFVLGDQERVNRGLPPLAGTTRLLSAAARRAALRDADPRLSASALPDGSWRSIWASSAPSDGLVLGAWFSWMYADGWDGKRTQNVSCTSRGAAGCWGHRDTILAGWGRAPHAGAFAAGYGAAARSYAMIFTPNRTGPVMPVLPPHWRQARFSSHPAVLFP